MERSRVTLSSSATMARPSRPVPPPPSPSILTRTVRISELRLIEGKAPTTSGDVVMDAGTAHKYHFKVGQPVRVLSAGPPLTYTITGIAQFGNAPNLAGATFAAFTLPTAQAVVGEVGQLDDIIIVTKPGADKAVVQRDIARALPAWGRGRYRSDRRG